MLRRCKIWTPHTPTFASNTFERVFPQFKLGADDGADDGNRTRVFSLGSLSGIHRPSPVHGGSRSLTIVHGLAQVRAT